MQIKQIIARQTYDSRGYPTVEADVVLDDGTLGRAAVPSGASTGEREALELRDGEKAFSGKGVNKALSNIVDKIAPAVVGLDADNQSEIDETMKKLDGTENKSGLGANAMLAVSLACAHADAKSKNVPLYQHFANISGNTSLTLPTPMCNIINGGKHAKGSTDFQEFMIVPSGAKDLSTALQICSEVFHSLGAVLVKNNQSTTVGDEGGYAPHLDSNRQALELIVQAITEAGYTPGQDVSIALDVAASELFEEGQYNLATENRKLSSVEMIQYYEEFVSEFPIVSIEDGLDENDWENWAKLQLTLGDKIMLVGDDLLVTNTKYIQQAIDNNSCNAVLIKPNQIGSLTETIQAVQMAQKAGFNTIISHRSGETEDTTIAHLAVGLAAPYIKTGSFSRSERLAKYNELLRIGESLNQ
jgi:enolase